MTQEFYSGELNQVLTIFIHEWFNKINEIIIPTG